MAAAGADLVEVGFPFSDPIADGPVIQASYTRALEEGAETRGHVRRAKDVTAGPGWQMPLVGMASYSLMYRKGPAAFLDRGDAAGLSGAVVPDLPAEEADDWPKLAADRDFKLILLVTPTTVAGAGREDRAGVRRVRVRGERGRHHRARDRLPPELKEMLARLRTMTDLPLCVGFGVSRPEQVRELKAMADGVIVGSALVKKLEGAGTPEGRAKALGEVAALVGELAGSVVSRDGEAFAAETSACKAQSFCPRRIPYGRALAAQSLRVAAKRHGCHAPTLVHH